MFLCVLLYLASCLSFYPNHTPHVTSYIHSLEYPVVFVPEGMHKDVLDELGAMRSPHEEPWLSHCSHAQS